MRAVASSKDLYVAVGVDASGGDEDAAAWSRVVHDEAVFGGERGQVMRAVAAAGPGFVAVGEDGSSGDIDAAVWVSTDGLAWTPVSHMETVFGGDGFEAMWGVIDTGSVVVAVGVDSPDADQDAAAWVSPSGLTWSSVRSARTAFGGDGLEAIYDVETNADGALAVGLVIDRSDQDAAVWIAVHG